jgi:hypothetical protein
MTSKQIPEGDVYKKPREGAKVLVIGSLGHGGVACMDWMQEDIPNIADFDVVIVNTGTLTGIINDWASRNVLERQEWEALYRRLNKVEERLLRVGETKGIICAIVYPPASVTREGISSYTSTIRNSDWDPFPVSRVEEGGDTKEVLDDHFQRYFDAVGSWVFYFRANRDSYFFMGLEEKWGSAFHVSCLDRPIVINRQRQAIGLTFAYGLHAYTSHNVWGADRKWKAEPDFVSGSVYYLPPPTRVSDDEAVRILLEDLCGIEARATAPGWAALVDLPGSCELEDQIRARQGQIHRVQKELDPLLNEKERREAFKAILYETGITPLQETVEAAFKELGFKTLPSEVSDEFYIEFGGQQALVEVKGVDKSASLKDVRQVIDYQLEYEQRHGDSIKAILVVNAWRHLPPEKRGLARTLVFPDNVVKRAEANNIALLDTVELFNALNAFWLGQVETQDLFDKLLDTRGVVKLLD